MVLGMGRHRKIRAPQAEEQIQDAEAHGQIFVAEAQEQVQVVEAPEQVQVVEAQGSEPDERPVPTRGPRRGVARVLLSLFLVVGLRTAVFASCPWTNVDAPLHAPWDLL